jgi:hypothetical protein
MKRASVVLVGLCLALLSACGSSSSKSASGSGPAPSASAVCADYQALTASLRNLASLNVVPVGANGLKAAVEDVQAKASALGSSSEQFAPQVNALKSAVTQLTDTLNMLPSGGLDAALGRIGPQISAVAKAGQDLQTAVGSACPAASS